MREGLKRLVLPLYGLIIALVYSPSLAERTGRAVAAGCFNHKFRINLRYRFEWPGEESPNTSGQRAR